LPLRVAQQSHNNRSTINHLPSAIYRSNKIQQKTLKKKRRRITNVYKIKNEKQNNKLVNIIYQFGAFIIFCHLPIRRLPKKSELI